MNGIPQPGRLTPLGSVQKAFFFLYSATSAVLKELIHLSQTDTPIFHFSFYISSDNTLGLYGSHLPERHILEVYGMWSIKLEKRLAHTQDAPACRHDAATGT